MTWLASISESRGLPKIRIPSPRRPSASFAGCPSTKIAAQRDRAVRLSSTRIPNEALMTRTCATRLSSAITCTAASSVSNLPPLPSTVIPSSSAPLPESSIVVPSPVDRMTALRSPQIVTALSTSSGPE